MHTAPPEARDGQRRARLPQPAQPREGCAQAEVGVPACAFAYAYAEWARAFAYAYAEWARAFAYAYAEWARAFAYAYAERAAHTGVKIGARVQVCTCRMGGAYGKCTSPRARIRVQKMARHRGNACRQSGRCTSASAQGRVRVECEPQVLERRPRQARRGRRGAHGHVRAHEASVRPLWRAHRGRRTTAAAGSGATGTPAGPRRGRRTYGRARRGGVSVCDVPADIRIRICRMSGAYGNANRRPAAPTRRPIRPCKSPMNTTHNMRM